MHHDQFSHPKSSNDSSAKAIEMPAMGGYDAPTPTSTGDDGDEEYENAPWNELRESPVPIRPVLIALGVMVVLDFLVAIATGLYLNGYACGTSWDCDISDVDFITGDGHRLDAQMIRENGLGDGKINFIVSPAKTAAVALTLSAVTLAIRTRCHPRLYGIYSFLMFVALALTAILNVYSSRFTASAAATSSQLATQFKNIVEDDWDPGNSWATIKSAEGFYAWLKGPIRQLLFTGDSNAGCGEAARANPSAGTDPHGLAPMCNNAPGPPNPNPPKSQRGPNWQPGPSESNRAQGTWLVLGCFIRQVRVLPQYSSLMAGSSILPAQQIYPEFRPEIQDMSVRVWNTSSGKVLREGVMDNDSPNAFEIKTVVPPNFLGSRFIGSSYPGQAGQVFGGDCDYLPNGTGTTCSTGMGPYPGWWNGFASPTPDGSKFDEDVKNMKEGWWIDERTRMVQFACRAANANTNQNMLAFYTLEFGASGLVNPMEALITSEVLNRDIEDIWNPVNPFMLFFFYYFNDEIYELVTNTVRKYFLHSGWLNLLDWIMITSGT